MADKALKLDVPLPSGSTRRLCVKNKDGRPFKFDGDKFRPEHVDLSGNVVLVQNFFGENNKVPDVSRYRIDSKWQPICDLEVPESRLQLQTQPGSIVLLLESPSVDEYRCGNINWPIAPAKGKSGENIDRCLGKLLSGIQAGHFVPGSHVIISNPIQFQTNLRAIHRQSTTQKTGSSKWKTLRNNVWKTL